MMSRTRLFVRILLALLLVGGCFAAIIAPLLTPPAQAAPPRASSAPPGDIVISQFRFQGAQFIEIFNRSCDTAVPVAGYTVRASSGGGTGSTLIYTFPTGASIASGHYFLLGGPGYAGSPTPDDTYTSGIDSTNGGVAILPSADPNAIPLDQVGFNPNGYFEGTVLPELTDPAQSYVRNTSSSMVVDTNNNSADFAAQTGAPIHASADSDTCGNPTPIISGNVQVAGATLSYTDGTPKSVASDVNGNYSLAVSPGWTGTVTISRAGFKFNPGSRTYGTAVTASKTGENYAAVLSPPTSLSVLINEVAWGGTRGSAGDQWIELYNPNNFGVDVVDMQLIGTSGTLGTSGVFDLKDILTDDVLVAHGFLVIEKRKDVFKALPTSPYTCGGITYTIEETVPSTLALSTYGERLILEGPAGQVDAADHLGGAWPAGLGGTSVAGFNRASMERHGVIPDAAGAWFTYVGPAPCGGTVQDSSNFVVKGSPGEPNWATTVNATPSPTATHYKTATPFPPTPFAHMVLNEFLPRAGYDWNQDGAVDVYDEFVELKNLGPINAALGGWKIDVISPEGPSSYILPSQTLQPGQRIVFYHLKTGLSLYDSGGTVRLISNRGVVVDARGYGPAANADQSICRLPDGYYWRFPCFPTPGNENSETGLLPVPPPVVASLPPPCLMSDIIPDPFRLAECYGFGAGVFNPAYWDDQSGFNAFLVPDNINKNSAEVK